VRIPWQPNGKEFSETMSMLLLLVLLAKVLISGVRFMVVIGPVDFAAAAAAAAAASLEQKNENYE
jgi:NhaP-type Na+/H+ or K+/H+ antiporter